MNRNDFETIIFFLFQLQNLVRTFFVYEPCTIILSINLFSNISVGTADGPVCR